MSEVRPENHKSRWRYWLFLCIFLLGILIGWLLAPRCPPCGNAMSPANAGTGGGAKLHGGPGAGDHSAGPPGGGPGTKGGGADGGPPNPGPEAASRNVDSASRTGTASDQAGSGRPSVSAGGDAPDPPPDQVLEANDFRYDKTGLPRYAQSVSTIGSTLSHPGGETSYHSTCAIVTSSPFADVVDWYKAQLPPGWHAQVVGDVGALAQQVSIGSVMSALTAATQPNGAATSNASPSAAPSGTAAGGTMSVALFSPPTNTAGQPSLMIQQASQTVKITMSKDGADP